MTTFAVYFNEIQRTAQNIAEYSTALNGYRAELNTLLAALNSSAGMQSFAPIRSRLQAVETELQTTAEKSGSFKGALEQILREYRRTEEKLASSAAGLPPDYLEGTSGFSVRTALEKLKPLHTDTNDFDAAGTRIHKSILQALLMLLKNTAGNAAGNKETGKESKEDYLKRLSDMFDFPKDIFDGISSLYDVFDKEGFDESGTGGLIVSILSVLSGGAMIADSGTASELYRNSVDYVKDSAGALKGLLSVMKKADWIPDNEGTASALFGLKTLKNALGFTTSFLKNYEENQGDAIGFLRDSGEMGDKAAGFVKGLYTSEEGFLKGLQGKELIAAEMWKTAFSSLYTAASYTTGDIIDKAGKGTLDLGSGAESFGKGAVSGVGKIHKFLTLGLVDADTDKTWDIFIKHVDKNSQLVTKYGHNWFTRTGLIAYATGKSFVCGGAEAIWSNSYAAAEKICTNVDTAFRATRDTCSAIWNAGKNFFRGFGK